MIEDYHFIYSQWNGLLHICLPEPPSTPPEVMHRKFGLKNPSDVAATPQTPCWRAFRLKDSVF